jgi:hypothetical protein
VTGAVCDDVRVCDVNGGQPVTDDSATGEDSEAADESRAERLRRNASSDPQSKTHEDEHNPMHSDSWSGGSIVPEAKQIARGEAPPNQPGGGPNTPEPAQAATPSDVTRPWSPEPTVSDTSGSTPGVDYSGRPRGENADEKDDDDEPRQAPPTTSPQKGEPEGGKPETTKLG